MEDLVGKEILLGTYEAFVLGYKLDTETNNLVTSFADHAHSGCIRSIAASDKFMISSGDDENVKIFNLRKRSEHGALTHADGTINAMRFYDRKHLFTGGEDGKVTILKAGVWRVEKTLFKHQAGVIDIAIHPSGKLALSIGKDRKLVTWNLIKGRSAYVTNIKELPDFVRWSPSGEYYFIGFYKRIDVYSLNTASIEFTIELPGRPNDVIFLDDVTFCIAGDMPQIRFYSLVTKELISECNAHETRVRCISLIERRDENADKLDGRILITASNDGLVKVWQLSLSDEAKFETKEVASVDTKCRITCMFVHQVPEISNGLDKPDEQSETSAAQPIVKERKKKRTKKSEGIQVVTEGESPQDDVTDAKKMKTSIEPAVQKRTKSKIKKAKTVAN